MPENSLVVCRRIVEQLKKEDRLIDAGVMASLCDEVEQLRWQVKITNELAEVRGKLMHSMNKDCALLNSLRSKLNELLLGGNDED